MTAFLLLADSGPTCEDPKNQSVSFAVTGNCGLPGEISVFNQDCTVGVTGADEVGLPSRVHLGPSGDLQQRDWSLEGEARAPLEDGGTASVARRCEFLEGGNDLRCRDEGIATVVCTATLTPL